ncbi:MAG: VWA domain-containing protein [Psychromonas sp.]|nr:VWA domain-containing protein [Psychromonas sp.]
MITEFGLAISALESGVIESIVSEAINAPEFFATLESSNSIKDSVNIWKEKIKNQLATKPIETNLEDELLYYQEVKEYCDDFFLKNIEQTVAKLESSSPFYSQAVDLIAQQKRKYNPLFKHHFCEKWYQCLFDKLKEERLKDLEKDKLLQELYQRSETIRKLNEIDAAVNEQKNLRLWDMANAKLTKRDINNLKKVTKFLQQHGELQKIAAKLGRMANKIETAHLSNVKIEQIKQVETKNSCRAGNIVGVHASDDLERLLPAEAMYLTMPELETVFYKHLADKRLATYQLQSTEQKNEKIITFEKQSKQAKQEKGPFVIAIDASGSMMGLPEQYAKAFAYGLMQIALEENRDCYIIMFSTHQITYELSKQHGLSEILSFLSYSFNGGTDLTPVLEQSIDLMSTEKYINADLIVISDFIAPPQPDSVLNKIKDIKERENRFHALNLSKYGNPELLAIFDHYWEYYPSKLTRLKRLLKDKP